MAARSIIKRSAAWRARSLARAPDYMSLGGGSARISPSPSPLEEKKKKKNKTKTKAALYCSGIYGGSGIRKSEKKKKKRAACWRVKKKKHAIARMSSWRKRKYETNIWRQKISKICRGSGSEAKPLVKLENICEEEKMCKGIPSSHLSKKNSMPLCIWRNGIENNGIAERRK